MFLFCKTDVTWKNKNVNRGRDEVSWCVFDVVNATITSIFIHGPFPKKQKFHPLIKWTPKRETWRNGASQQKLSLPILVPRNYFYSPFLWILLLRLFNCFCQKRRRNGRYRNMVIVSLVCFQIFRAGDLLGSHEIFSHFLSWQLPLRACHLQNSI